MANQPPPRSCFRSRVSTWRNSQSTLRIMGVVAPTRNTDSLCTPTPPPLTNRHRPASLIPHIQFRWDGARSSIFIFVDEIRSFLFCFPFSPATHLHRRKPQDSCRPPVRWRPPGTYPSCSRLAVCLRWRAASGSMESLSWRSTPHTTHTTVVLTFAMKDHPSSVSGGNRVRLCLDLVKSRVLR